MGYLCRHFLGWTVHLPFGSSYKKRQVQRVSVKRLRLAPVLAEITPDKSHFRQPPSPSEIIIPTSETPVVSIIISTYGLVDLTLFCLQSIMTSAPEVELEVIVIDDAYPKPEDLTPLKGVKGIILTRNKQNLGFLRSNNNAIPMAKGRYLYLLNNDTQVLPGAIDRLVQTLQTHTDVGLVGSKLIFNDGTLQEAGSIIWSDGSGWNFGRGGDPSRPEFNYVREVDYCSGASIMISKDLFCSLGGFDPIYAPAYYEDTDLAMRVRQKGFKVLYVPDSVVIHHEGQSHGTDVNSGVKAHQVMNQVKFVERWKDTLDKKHYSGPKDWTRARDHGRQRKVILIIDRYPPEPDRDAGSCTMITIFKSFLDAGWIVKLWSYEQTYNPAYTNALEQMGVEVLDQRWPGSLSAWLQENGANLDHVLISRPTIAKKILPILKARTNAIISFYGHDFHFARLRRQAIYAPYKKAKQLLSEAKKNEKMERSVWNQVDLVFYLSNLETQFVQEIAPWVIAKTVHLFSFPISPKRVAPPAERTLLFVGGFAHFPNADAAQFLIHEILPKLEAKIGPVNVILAGSDPSESVLALASSRVEITGYISDEALGRLYQRARVSVVPLRIGAGVKGKVIEALSYGLPLVTTSIGAQGIQTIENTVPIHDNAEELASALAILLEDDVAWLAQSHSQQEFAGKQFSFSSAQKALLDAFSEAEKIRKTKTSKFKSWPQKTENKNNLQLTLRK